MIELLVAIAVIVAMVKIANADDQSPWMWGGITFLLCFAAIALVPLPVLRVGIAGVVAFLAMIGWKVARDR